MTHNFAIGARALSLLAAAGILSSAVLAQDAAAPAATKTAPPAVKMTPVKPAVAAKPAAAPAAAVATDPAAKPVMKKVSAPSPCQGLDEKACGGNKACGWIVPKDANDKTGKLQDPYCRKVAGVALKKPAVKPVMKPAATAVKAAPAAAADTAAPAAAKPAVKAAVKVAPVSAPPAVKPPAPAAAQ